MKTEAQPIEEARDDSGAFAELYRRHAGAIHPWACARTDPRTGEDLTAETFAQAALSLKRFRNEAEGSAAPWLFGIAKNLLRRYREQQRVETAARRRLGMPVSSEEVDLDAADERARAERMAPEINETLGCTYVAARLRVMRALDSLARGLKGAAS